MAFRNKSAILDEFIPDVAIIQECESEEVLLAKKSTIQYNEHIWVGKNKNKGLGIMSFGSFHVEKLDHNEEFEYVVPVRVFTDKIEFFLLAIWTQMVNGDISQSYVVQAANAFNYYKNLLGKENILIIWDFNSNSIWDSDSPKEYTHRQMVELLAENNIVSVYHSNFQEEHGKEKTPTLYFTKNKDKPYHIDYFFIKQALLKNIEKYQVWDHDSYIGKSDHMPLFVEINLEDSLECLKWTFAKTYAHFSPHWYVVLWLNDPFLRKINHTIDVYGENFLYLGKQWRIWILGEYRYWIDEGNEKDTFILNRTFYDEDKMKTFIISKT